MILCPGYNYICFLYILFFYLVKIHLSSCTLHNAVGIFVCISDKCVLEGGGGRVCCVRISQDCSVLILLVLTLGW